MQCKNGKKQMKPVSKIPIIAFQTLLNRSPFVILFGWETKITTEREDKPSWKGSIGKTAVCPIFTQVTLYWINIFPGLK